MKNKDTMLILAVGIIAYLLMQQNKTATDTNKLELGESRVKPIGQIGYMKKPSYRLNI